MTRLLSRRWEVQFVPLTPDSPPPTKPSLFWTRRAAASWGKLFRRMAYQEQGWIYKVEIENRRGGVRA